MKTLYFDCFSGISGDMCLGALLDLGVDKNILLNGLKLLNVDGYEIRLEKKLKNGIMGTQFTVVLDGESHHEHEHAHQHDHSHSHEHHHHDKNEAAVAHNQEHEHRNLSDIEYIINSSELSQRVKELSIKIFRVVAETEGKIHGKPAEEVHFHEVGAIDSIVDIIGTAICVDALKVDKIIFSKLPLSRGFVKCQHGIFPLPAPATLEILKGVPVYYNDAGFELVTPTGAAIVKALGDSYGDIEVSEIEKIGYGLGKKTYEVPNVLRAVLLTEK